MIKFSPLPLVVLLLCSISTTSRSVAQSPAKYDDALESPPIVAKTADDKAVMKLFTAYPKNNVLYGFMWSHLYEIRNEVGMGKIEKVVFMVTSFKDDTAREASNYWIGAKGRTIRDDVLHNWAIQSSGKPRLSEERVATVLKAVQSLPPSDAPSSVKNLLIVSYTDDITGTKYRTRFYDATKPPAVLVEIGRIWGEGKVFPPLGGR